MTRASKLKLAKSAFHANPTGTSVVSVGIHRIKGATLSSSPNSIAS